MKFIDLLSRSFLRHWPPSRLELEAKRRRETRSFETPDEQLNDREYNWRTSCWIESMRIAEELGLYEDRQLFPYLEPDGLGEFDRS